MHTNTQTAAPAAASLNDLRRHLRDLLPRQAFAPDPRGILYALVQLLVIASATHAIGRVDSMLLRVLFGAIVGHSYACLGFWGHHASHGAFTRHKIWRPVLETFMWSTALGSATSWRVYHNGLHHRREGTLEDSNRYFTESEATPLRRLYSLFVLPNRQLPFSPGVFLYAMLTTRANALGGLFTPHKRQPSILTNLGRYSRRDRICVAIDLTLALAIQILLFWLAGVGLVDYLPSLVVALLVASAVGSFYLHTQHGLYATSNVVRPLNATSLRLPRWIDWLHLNCSHHTAHHVFEAVPPRYLPRVTELLARYYPRALQRLRPAQVWSEMRKNPVFKPDPALGPRPELHPPTEYVTYAALGTPALPSSAVIERRNMLRALIEQAASPHAVAARYKHNGAWVTVSFGELRDEVARASDALVSLGVRPGDRVAILAETSLRWMVADLAISAANAVTVPIYPSLTGDDVARLLARAEPIAIFVDHDRPAKGQPGRLARARSYLRAGGTLSATIMLEDREKHDAALSWAEFVAHGDSHAAQHPHAFEQRVAAIKLSDPCTLIYTSGTSGEPRGVLVTHGNWASQASAIADLDLMRQGDRVMLFLPLAHSFAQATKAIWLSLGYELIVADSVETLPRDMRETRPTVLPTVPRMLEKAFQQLRQEAGRLPWWQQTLFAWGLERLRRADRAAFPSDFERLRFGLARAILFPLIRRRLLASLGGRLRLFISGGAALSREVAFAFHALELPVLEGYGLSETCAAVTLNRLGAVLPGRVGLPLRGVQIRLAEDGEVLVKGPTVVPGYFDDPGASSAAFDDAGWFRTGDIGQLDAEGHLSIVDRKKDLIATAGGKKVAPQPIEQQLRAFPIVAEAMVFGEGRKYLTALLTVEPAAARALFATAGEEPPARDAELCVHPRVREAVARAVQTVNASLPSFASLKRYAVLDRALSMEAGELTPTLKVRRAACAARFRSTLEELYRDHEPPAPPAAERWLLASGTN